MRIALGDWLPDLAELDQSLLQVATNGIPSKNSYLPIRAPSPYSDALAANPRGLWLAKTNAGDFEVWAATETNIYELVGTSWTSRGSGYTGPATDENWAGAQFGTDFYWCNINDGLKKIDIEAGSSVSAVSSSPSAKYMDVVEEYLCTANDSDSPRKFRWSDTNDGDTWSGGNSGSQTFPDGGAITAICGAAGLIIQEEVIRRIIPTGTTEVFDFEKLEQAKGSISPESVIRIGSSVAYLAEDGFWFDGQPIGENAVNRYFLNQINQNNLYTVIGRYDPVRRLFWWHFRSANNDTYDRALIYSWRNNRWAEVQTDILFAAQSATTGYTLESLAVEYPDLDEVPVSLDSRRWLGGRPTYAVIDSDKKLGFLEGATLEPTFEFGEKQLLPGMRARVTGVRPLVDSENATVAIRKRERLGDSAVWGDPISQQSSGICPANAGARYHRFRMNVPAGSSWTHAQGIEIPDGMIVPDGMR